MMMKALAVVLAVLAAGTQAVMQGNATVYYANGSYSAVMGIVDVKNPTAVAFGVYTDMSLTPSAFGQLSVTTVGSFPDAVQTFAAGYVEGVLTNERIFQQYGNTHAWVVSHFKGGVIPQNFETFFMTQDTWARQQIASNTSAFWQAYASVLSQFDGLVAGYASVAPANAQLTTYQMMQLNAMGDFLDLIPALSPSDAPQLHNMTDEDLMTYVRKTTHCSALIKVKSDLTDIWFSHAAWFIYQGTIRIFKHYNFNLKQPIVAGQKMSFASYPGYLSSLDDYYSVWSSGLVVLETSNSIFNQSLYSLVTPSSLFAWQRVRLANLISRNGSDWGFYFSQYNSGTYNNQYDVIAVGQFAPGKALPDGFLTIVEQIPGLVVYGDATIELERGYFPSYNVPYFAEIYDLSGYGDTIQARRQEGEALGELSGLDYQLAPRAKIFRRDAGKVDDLDAFLSLMRYNDYKNDPYSEMSPWNAICSRGDLAVSGGGPDGCYDCKAGSFSMWKNMQSVAINGPTTGSIPPGGSLPPFSWSQYPSTAHAGLPDTYDFTFETMQPIWF